MPHCILHFRLQWPRRRWCVDFDFLTGNKSSITFTSARVAEWIGLWSFEVLAYNPISLPTSRETRHGTVLENNYFPSRQAFAESRKHVQHYKDELRLVHWNFEERSTTRFFIFYSGSNWNVSMDARLFGPLRQTLLGSTFEVWFSYELSKNYRR